MLHGSLYSRTGDICDALFTQDAWLVCKPFVMDGGLPFVGELSDSYFAICVYKSDHVHNKKQGGPHHEA